MAADLRMQGRLALARVVAPNALVRQRSPNNEKACHLAMTGF